MKKRKVKKVLIVALGITLTSSCTMTKRRYSKGYYIEKNKNYALKKQVDSKTEFTESKLKPKEIKLKPKIDQINIDLKEQVEIREDLMASVDNEIILPKHNIFKQPEKTTSINEIEVVKNERKINSFKDKSKKRKIGKDEPIEITKREIWAIMGLIFSLASIAAGGIVFPALGIVFAILGFKSQFKVMRWVSLSLSFLLIGAVLINLFTFLSYTSNLVFFYPKWYAILYVLF